jgi:hypothetical protein
MDEQSPPNLDEMNEEEAKSFFFWYWISTSSEEADARTQVRHKDYVMERPQEYYRVRGRKNMRGFEKAREEASGPDLGDRYREIRRVIHRDELWVVEMVEDIYGDGSDVYIEVYIIELRDGKIWRETQWYAEHAEPPQNLAQWIEVMNKP